jgi:hypothetical protein
MNETNSKKKPIEISQHQYYSAHGKFPKPAFANWAFLIWDDSSNKQVGEPVFVPHAMSYSDSKVWIKAYVRENLAAEVASGYLSVEVAP